jgi:hypothetical protein
MPTEEIDRITGMSVQPIRCHRPVHEAFNCARAPDSVAAQLDAAAPPNAVPDGCIDSRCGDST